MVERLAIDHACKARTMMINAHVSVLMDLQAKLPHSIELETDYRDWTQIIEYENKPKLSSLCEIIGHTTKK